MSDAEFGAFCSRHKLSRRERRAAKSSFDAIENNPALMNMSEDEARAYFQKEIQCGFGPITTLILGSIISTLIRLLIERWWAKKRSMNNG